MEHRQVSVILAFLFSLAPCFVMVHPHVMNGALFFLSAFSVWMLFYEKINTSFFFNSLDTENRRALYFFYTAPIVSVCIAQALRLEFSWPNYDSPSRILLCSPVFLTIYLFRLDVIKYLFYSVFAAFAYPILLILFGFTPERPDGRLGPYSMDLLTFGSLSLTLGILSLIVIGTFKKISSWYSIIGFSGFAAGTYLSIMSESRTGWLALPIVLSFWLFMIAKRNGYMFFGGGLIILGLFIVTILTVPTVKQRFAQAVADIQSYKWNGPNTETSIGERISFYRIGFSLFMDRPFSGWGDRSFAETIKKEDKYNFASQATREGVIHSGFHNEILTNAVRSGVWGILSSLVLFVVPGLIFVRAFFSKNDLVCKYGFYGLAYLICIFVSSLSTEIFNLKYTASFHALMLSMLMGATLAKMKNNHESCAS